MVENSKRFRLFWAYFFLSVLGMIGVHEYHAHGKTHIFLTYIMLSTVCILLFKVWVYMWPSTVHYGGHLSKTRSFRDSFLETKKMLRSATELHGRAHKIFIGGLFISMSSALSVLASRCYFDIAFEGSWIEYFRNKTSRSIDIHIHRFIDFIYHVLPFIVLLSLFFVYYEDIKKVSEKCTRLGLVCFFALPVATPMLMFSLWSICYDVEIIYYALNVKDWHVFPIIGGVWVLTVLPLQIFLRYEAKIIRTKDFYNLLFLCVTLFQLGLSVALIRPDVISMDLIFWSALSSFIFAILKFIDKRKKFVVYVGAFTMVCVYSSFFITEIYLWSLGGSDAYFYDMLVPCSFLKSKEIYFIYKGIFYVLIVYFVTLSYIEVLKNPFKEFFCAADKSCRRGCIILLATSQVLLFGLWGALKKQKYYDVAFTEHDNILFVGVVILVSTVIYRPFLSNGSFFKSLSSKGRK